MWTFSSKTSFLVKIDLSQKQFNANVLFNMQLISYVSDFLSNVLYSFFPAMKDPVKGHLLHLFVISFFSLIFLFLIILVYKVIENLSMLSVFLLSLMVCCFTSWHRRVCVCLNMRL